jgi:exonuclease III
MAKPEYQSHFIDLVGERRPDVISLQEVKLECEEGQPGVVKKGSKGEEAWKKFFKPWEKTFDAYLSLSQQKYGGQAVLVRKTMSKPEVSYNMGGQEGHFKSGRFIKLVFRDLVVRSVYAPFNGAGKLEHHQRRRQWDADLLEELREPDKEGKARVLMGDLNVVNRNSDITGNPEFWKRQCDQQVDEADRGFGGTTANERKRFQEILDKSGMTDTFTAPLDSG